MNKMRYYILGKKQTNTLISLNIYIIINLFESEMQCVVKIHNITVILT
jgi:hypothetical protein